MPTHIQPSVRRSQRNRGHTIKSPKYKHDLFVDPPNGRKVSKLSGNKLKLPEVKQKGNDPIVESEDEHQVNSSHPSKNYGKIVLYDKWKTTSKAAATYKKEIVQFQKESVKDKKEIEKLYREVRILSERNEKLEEKVEDLQSDLLDAKKLSEKNNAGKKKVSDSERIANMKATFQGLQQKKEYEHKSVLCDLELKYNQMELQYNAKVEKCISLEEEIKDLKKIRPL